jgi:hypothetical protein
VEADLARSQAFFRRVLGRPVSAFAFPFGAADHPTNDPAIPEQINRVLRRAGFRLAFASEAVPRKQGELEIPVMHGADRHRLPRVTVTSDLTPLDLLNTLRRSAPDPITPDLTLLHWAGNDATCAPNRDPVQPTALVVSATGYGRCAAPVNPVQWTDYRLTTDVMGVDRMATAFVGVRARITPGSRGRAEVVLGEAVIRVREQIGRRVRVLAARSLRPGEDHHVEVTVEGRRLTVRVDDLTPMVAMLDPALDRGAVDFGLAARGAQTLTFVAPRLIDLRKP